MTAEVIDGQLDLLAELNAAECDTCARLANGGSVSCGEHKRGPMYEWHKCSVCPGRYYGVPFDSDKGSSIHYGPVSVRYCSAACRPAAIALFESRRNAYEQQKNTSHTTTSTED
jgi:hypothetical protein